MSYNFFWNFLNVVLGREVRYRDPSVVSLEESASVENRRRCWVRARNQCQRVQGAYHSLVRQLSVSDKQGFFLTYE